MAADYTTALARLLSDAALLQRFRADPRAVCSELGATPDTAAALAQLDPDALELQAATLRGKRLHEVARLLPRTMARLGCRAEPLFRAYAEQQWPRGHQRHHCDALAFGQWLRRNGAGVQRSELAALELRLGRRRWTAGILRGRGLPSLLLSLRTRHGIRTVRIYLGPS